MKTETPASISTPGNGPEPGADHPEPPPSPGLRKDLDQMWEALLRNVKELRLRTMDFSDLWEEEEEEEEECVAVGTGPAPSPGSPGSPPLPPPLGRALGGGPPPPPPPPPPTTGPASHLGLPRQAEAGPVKTVKLFWNGLRELPALPRYSRFGPGTIWANLEPVPLDTARLRQLFECKTSGLQLFKKQSIRRKQELTVLELKRSNLINIGLAALPAPHIVRAALLSFDQCVLEREAIERLLTMVPTEEELKKIRDAQQAGPHLSLGSAEQFLLTLASISEVQARLQLWSFKMEYDTMEKVGSRGNNIGTIEREGGGGE
ncbi:hypothetical protein scyTo_0023469 [Scyliorhinus torazame]|uniref:FH2 domain-containing protein n=1 Tax=Scyliorhinus torazame TaxID=75743 RepID=A0A401QDI6_SCYTO|nr:hypothetical protein [Scyliorhinus torazame]